MACKLQSTPNLPEDELNILCKWRALFVKGDFYIFRHLKKGSIFIGGNDQVYSVIGLMTELEDIIPSYALPRMVQAVLLPFKGVVV